jgi:hypothetical protein
MHALQLQSRQHPEAVRDEMNGLAQIAMMLLLSIFDQIEV